MHRIPHQHVWNPDVQANIAIYSNSELHYCNYCECTYEMVAHYLGECDGYAAFRREIWQKPY